MDKSIKQIADELNIDKQIIYRYIKRNKITEVHHESLQNNQVKYYSEAVQTQIKQAFMKDVVHQEVHQEVHRDVLLDVLKKQLEYKDKQIESLQKSLDDIHRLLDQEQQLHMCEHQRRLQLEHINDTVASTINELKEENDMLNDMISYKKSKKWWKPWK